MVISRTFFEQLCTLSEFLLSQGHSIAVQDVLVIRLYVPQLGRGNLLGCLGPWLAEGSERPGWGVGMVPRLVMLQRQGSVYIYFEGLTTTDVPTTEEFVIMSSSPLLPRYDLCHFHKRACTRGTNLSLKESAQPSGERAESVDITAVNALQRGQN